MTKQTPVAVADNDGGGEAGADLATQRAQLASDLAWLVVRSHRRQSAAPAAERTGRRGTARKRRNPKR